MTISLTVSNCHKKVAGITDFLSSINPIDGCQSPYVDICSIFLNQASQKGSSLNPSESHLTLARQMFICSNHRCAGVPIASKSVTAYIVLQLIIEPKQTVNQHSSRMIYIHSFIHQFTFTISLSPCFRMDA